MKKNIILFYILQAITMLFFGMSIASGVLKAAAFPYILAVALLLALTTFLLRPKRSMRLDMSKDRSGRKPPSSGSPRVIQFPGSQTR